MIELFTVENFKWLGKAMLILFIAVQFLLGILVLGLWTLGCWDDKKAKADAKNKDKTPYNNQR